MHSPTAPSSATNTNEEFAHHFSSRAQQVETDLFGMWLFLATEVMFFGGAFVVYSIYRHANPEGFVEASNHLDIVLGAVNTVVLLTSSLTMALTVLYTHHGERRTALKYILATMLLGLAFISIKGFEYHHKYEQGIWPIGGVPFHWEGEHADGAHLFFSLYFAMTGLHALHMLIGISFMAWFAWMLTRERQPPLFDTRVEVLGLYWHFVDVIWIFLFPLLYLVERSA